MADKEHLIPKSVPQSYPDVYYALPESQLFYGTPPPNHFTWVYNPFTTQFQPYNPFHTLYPPSRTVGPGVSETSEGSHFPGCVISAGEGRQHTGGLPSVAAGNSQGKCDTETQGQTFGVSGVDTQARLQAGSEVHTRTTAGRSVYEEKRNCKQESQDLQCNLYGDIKQQLSDVQCAKVVNIDKVPTALDVKQTGGVGSLGDKLADSQVRQTSGVKQPSYDSSYPGKTPGAGDVGGGCSVYGDASGKDYWLNVEERGSTATADRLGEQMLHMTLPRDAMPRRNPDVVYVNTEQMQVFNDELLAARQQLEEYKQKYNSAVEEQGQYKKLVSDLSQQVTEKENENEVLKIQVQILKEDFDLEKEAKESTDSYYRERLKEEKEKRKQLEQMSPHRRDHSFSHLMNNAAVNVTPPVYHSQGNPSGGACYHDAATGRTCINTPTGNVTVTPSGVTISECKRCYEHGETSDSKRNVNIIINHRRSSPRREQNHYRSQSETNLQRVSSFEFPSDVVTDGENEDAVN